MTKQDFAAYFGSLARFTFTDPRAVLPFTKVVHTFFAVPINLLRRR